MREILFRGKPKDTGKWAQGYVYKIWERAFILWGMVNGVPDMVEVYPETVCQYTGLTDKNGNKIFEGDIVRHKPAQLLGVVKYSEKYMQFIVDDIDDGEQDCSGFINGVEIIGNIFDNPELLEVQNG